MPIDVLSALQSVGDPDQQGNTPGNASPQSGQSGAPGIDMLAALQYAGQQDAQPPGGPPPTALQSFGQGFGDTVYGLGNIAQHVAGAPLNLVRQGLRAGLTAAGMPDAGALFAPVSNSDYENMVANREQQYDRSRAAAGQTGIDWWRLAGNTANPINFMVPGGAAETALGRIAQAGIQGASIGAAQAAGTGATPGQMWWDTAKGAITGGATGGLLGSAVEGLAPALRFATNKVRNLVTNGQLSSSDAADQVVKEALSASGKDPSSFDMNLLKGMRQDVQSALDAGADISPQAIVNRAKAESLPVPVQLMRGQATRDPMLFTREQNLRGTGKADDANPVGRPITDRLTQQNAAFIGNLNALGAKDAMDPVSFGLKHAQTVQSFWDGLQAHKDALYAAVRNSDGQSAAMDGVTAADNIKAALDTPQASHVYDMLPANIRRTIDDIGSGQVPFSVAQMQSLDKMWGDAARGADGSTAYAINQARRIMADAPIADDTGDAARQAYFAARQAHAQQMSLVDPKLPNGMPNPNFQPLVKSIVMDGKPPEQLFGANFLNAAPSVAAKNMQFLSQLDPNAPQQIGQTLMGEIKRQAFKSSSDDSNVPVSPEVLRSWANAPVKSARLDALLPKPAVDTFHNLADVVEAAKNPPVASTVNTSNTGSALVNAAMSMLKNSQPVQIAMHLPLVHGVVKGLDSSATKTAVRSALNPGVTLKSLLTGTSTQAARSSLASRILVPAAVSYEGRKTQ